MGHKQNVIEINGKTYDVTTGTLVAPQKSTHPKITQPSKGKVMDGFLTKPQTKLVAPKPKINSPAGTPKPTARAHKPQKAEYRKPERAKTLMRSAVTKPKLISEHHQATPAITKPAHGRMHRAKQVPKSSLVSRFPSFSSHRAFVKKTEPLAVKPEPSAHNAAKTTTPHHQIKAKPAAQSAHSVQSAPISKSEALFNQAIAQATAKETYRPTHKKSSKSRLGRKLTAHKKIFRIAAGIAAVVILAGFITYQNLPNLYLRLASTKAGFAAAMPDYRPAGFTINGPIEASPGKITISFKATADNRNFHVTQRVSSWNSETLRENFLLAQNKAYQTLQEKGKTIFMYDGSSATWVSGGVWYQIEGDSNLSNEQIVRLANSL